MVDVSLGNVDIFPTTRVIIGDSHAIRVRVSTTLSIISFRAGRPVFRLVRRAVFRVFHLLLVLATDTSFSIRRDRFFRTCCISHSLVVRCVSFLQTTL